MELKISSNVERAVQKNDFYEKGVMFSRVFFTTRIIKMENTKSLSITMIFEKFALQM